MEQRSLTHLLREQVLALGTSCVSFVVAKDHVRLARARAANVRA